MATPRRKYPDAEAREVAERLRRLDAKENGPIDLKKYRSLVKAEIEWGGNYRLRIMGHSMREHSLWGHPMNGPGDYECDVRAPAWWHTAFVEEYPLEDPAEIVAEEEVKCLLAIYKGVATHFRALKKSEVLGLPEDRHLVSRFIWEAKVRGGKDLIEQFLWRNGREALLDLTEQYMVKNRLLKPSLLGAFREEE